MGPGATTGLSDMNKKTIKGLYATFYQGHEIALLQKEAKSFSVRQGSTFKDEVYIEAEVDFDRRIGLPEDRYGNAEEMLVKGNLGILLKEATLSRTIRSSEVEDLTYVHDGTPSLLLEEGGHELNF